HVGFNFLTMKIFRLQLLVSLLSFFAVINSFGQADDADPVTYEELYDEPENINRLFLQFQPIIGELYATNPTAGFGIEATYFVKNKMHFNAQTRKAYLDRFDMMRYNAVRNSDMQNDVEIHNYYQLGFTYHFKDGTESSETKMILYKNSYRGNRWAARVPLNITIPSKVRKITGGRLGGYIYDHTIYVNNLLSRQGLSFADIKTAEGLTLPEYNVTSPVDSTAIRAFSRMDVAGIYVGGSMSWIRNVAVDIDKHKPGVDDLIFTAFFDIMVAPWIGVENLFYENQEYNIDALNKSMIGARIGMDGKFNRTLSWGYGAEMGYRPGLKKGGFFALVKISLPIYSTNLNYTVESFGK
ncbi:MAG: hypothetical protein OEY34_09610, partial [Cyclobacteriaceae bacterium]|nr:hypothetical protein [Cyclobacteriaceae bacterium]